MLQPAEASCWWLAHVRITSRLAAYLAACSHSLLAVRVLPVRWSFLLLLVSLGVSLLVVRPARAQVPALLLGQWEMRQISFVASQTVPPDILDRMNNPEVAELNQEVAAGTGHLVVEFRPDGTYRFTVARAGQPNRIEIGTYVVSGKTLLAQSPATEGGSSFDHQQLVQISRRRLVVEFPVGDDLPGVVEEIAYRRAP